LASPIRAATDETSTIDPPDVIAYPPARTAANAVGHPVEPAEPAHHLLRTRLHLGELRGVERVGRSADLVGQRAQPVGVAGGQDQPRAAGGQSATQVRADAAGRAEDQVRG
jgi:hypothetical protein